MHDAEQDGRPRIVVGVDASPSSVAALRWALQRARRLGDKVEVVHAFAPGVSEAAAATERRRAGGVLDEVVTAAADPGERARITPRLVEGPAVDCLLAAAAGAELLVLGASTRRSLPWPGAGPVPAACLRSAPCPVVVIPSAPITAEGRVPTRRSRPGEVALWPPFVAPE